MISLTWNLLPSYTFTFNIKCLLYDISRTYTFTFPHALAVRAHTCTGVLTHTHSQKGIQSDIIIVENGETTSDKKRVAEKLNNFFIEAVDNLDIKPYLIHNNRISKNTQDIIDKYENHPSIKMIKENINDENKFSFQDTSKEDLQLQIKNLDTKKPW